MSDESKQSGRSGKNGEIKVPPRNWLLWILILGSILLRMIFHGRSDNRTQITRIKLVELVDNNLIQKGTIHYNPQSSVLNEITGEYRSAEGGSPIAFKIKTRLDDDLEKKLLNSGKFETLEPNTFLLNLFVTILPIIFVAFLIFFFFILLIIFMWTGVI